MNAPIQLPKRNITALRGPCDAYSGMGAAVTLNGVQVIVIAGSLEELDKALPTMTLDHTICPPIVAAAAVNFHYAEPEL